MRVRQCSSWRQHQFLYEVHEESSHDLTSSKKDLTLSISEENNITRTILNVAKGNIASERFRKTTRSRFSIWFMFRIWRRIAPLSFLLKEYPLGRDHLNNVLINEELPIFFSIFSHFIHSTLLNISNIFNLTEQEGMLSSRCILNLKRLVTLKYKQRKTSNASQESDLEACQWFYEITMIGTNIETPKSRITKWSEFQENEVGTK